MRVLGGEHQPSEGEIRLDGAPTVFHSTRSMRWCGKWSVIRQEMALAPDLSVLVMREGALAGELRPDAYSEETLRSWRSTSDTQAA